MKLLTVTQKFMRGDLVKIIDKLPDCQSHFRSGVEAIVLGSYGELCENEAQIKEQTQYSLFFLDSGNIAAWYDEDQFILIKERDVNQIYRRITC